MARVQGLVGQYFVVSIRGNATGKILADTGAFLKDIDQFDFLEFGITAKDAKYMPLSTRKLVEVAFLGLQDSGIDYRGKTVGCYMSGVAHDFYNVSGHVSCFYTHILNRTDRMSICLG